MFRWRTSFVLALFAVAAAGAAVPAVHGQATDEAEVRDLTFPVEDIELETSSLDRSVRRAESSEAVRVTLAADVLFAFDSARLSRRSQPGIAEAVREIRRAEPEAVVITGHTDSKGGDAYNRRLSLRRADAVSSRLRDRLGEAAPTRIRSRGLGESRPVVADTRPDGSDNPRGRARNRRVEIRIPGG